MFKIFLRGRRDGMILQPWIQRKLLDMWQGVGVFGFCDHRLI